MSTLDAAAREQDRLNVVAEKLKTVEDPSMPMANARLFAKELFYHPERFLLIHQGGVFFDWNGTCWPEMDDAELRSRLYKFFEHAVYCMEDTKVPFAPTRYKVADLMDAMKAVTHISKSVATPSWYKSAPLPADEIISCENGLIHVPTRTLHPHTPCFYTHHSVPFAFDPSAPRPTRWLKFLDEIWPDDPESIETLGEVFGYMVSGDTRQQKLFLLVGPKRGGKGTIARILKGVMGQHNVAGPTLAGIGTNFGLSPLIGKPAAIISDARIKASDTSVVTERLLSISGEDTLTVDRKYKEPWTGQLPSRFLILSNELPRLTDSSGALASRFIMMTTTQSFYGRENPNLTSELLAELPSIFNWSLDGFERLRTRGYFRQPKASQDAIRELEDLGSPVGAFIRDRCMVGPAYSVRRDSLYSEWKQWCEDHGRRPSAAETFGRDLRAACPGLRTTQARDDGNRHREYQGIGLAQAGTCATPMYPYGGKSGQSGEYIEPEHVPPCANCGGEGCAWCEGLQ